MFHVIKKQMMKPFQLIKSFYLFKDDSEMESSIDVNDGHIPGDI